MRQPLVAFVAVVVLLLPAGVHPQTATPGQRFPDGSPHREHFITTAGGVRLQILDWGGHGPVLLFVPGLGQTAHIFDGLAPRFTDRCHVVGMTRRGHGRSDAPATGYDLDTLVDDLASVVTHLGGGPVTLVGHSFAGLELTTFARRKPGQVERLIYIEAAYDFSRMPDDSTDPVSMAPLPDDMASLAGGRRWFERSFGFWHEAVGADANDVNVKPDGTMRLESMRPDVASALWKVMTAFTPDYSAITAPILAIYALSEGHPLVRRDGATEQIAAADTFWRAKWLPYQRDSITQLIEAKGPTDVVILRNTQHLCFLKPSDERQVVSAITRFNLPIAK